MAILAPTFTATDTGRVLNLTALSTLIPGASDKMDLFSAMRTLDLRSPLTSCNLLNGTLTITFQDGRTYSSTASNGKSAISTGGQFFTPEELGLCQNITNLVRFWMTSTVALLQMEAIYS